MMKITYKVVIIIFGYLRTISNNKGSCFWEKFLKETSRKVREVCEGQERSRFLKTRGCNSLGRMDFH
jgi:hypothetical protein